MTERRRDNERQRDNDSGERLGVGEREIRRETGRESVRKSLKDRVTMRVGRLGEIYSRKDIEGEARKDRVPGRERPGETETERLGWTRS